VTDRDQLALELADVLAVEPLGLPLDALARRVRRRRVEVLAVLQADPRFTHSGQTRGSRWRLDGSGRNGTEWDGITSSGWVVHPPGLSRRQSVTETPLNGGAG
jgi:hypothetical protein